MSQIVQTFYKRARRPALRLMLLVALLTTLGGAPITAVTQPTLWYVAPTGAEVSSCGTLEQPCKLIATAIRKALPHDSILLAGGIYTETLEITKTLTLASSQPALTVIDGAGADSVIRVMSVTTALTITGLVIQHGRAPYGGGIDNFSGGSVQLINSTVVSNTATSAAGGGIFNYGALTLINSTIIDNIAATGGGIATNFGTLTITNTTISANKATAADGRGGGGIFAGNDAVTIGNTILAGNIGTRGPDCAGALTSSGYNLIGSDADCSIEDTAGDQVGTRVRPLDARLGPLDRYGGPTPTLTLRADSPAIDAGNPATPGSSTAACPITDQRGVTRPQLVNGTGVPRCDIGAYEYDAPIILPWLYLPDVRR